MQYRHSTVWGYTTSISIVNWFDAFAVHISEWSFCMAILIRYCSSQCEGKRCILMVNVVEALKHYCLIMICPEMLNCQIYWKTPVIIAVFQYELQLYEKQINLSCNGCTESTTERLNGTEKNNNRYAKQNGLKHVFVSMILCSRYY